MRGIDMPLHIYYISSVSVGCTGEGCQVEVEWLILADAAQVVGNKLYLLGGGWDRLTVNSGSSVNRSFAVSVSVKVPWNETNQKHSVEVEVVTEDPATEQPKSLVKVPSQLEVGRPPGIPQGQDQRVQLAISMNLKLDVPVQTPSLLA